MDCGRYMSFNVVGYVLLGLLIRFIDSYLLIVGCCLMVLYIGVGWGLVFM